MHIRSIRYRLIRKTNFDVPCDDFNNGIHHFLQSMDEVNLSKLNILIGQNGSGKSTLIDMVKSLKFHKVLRTLPRENPKGRCSPGFAIEFEDQNEIVVIFSTPSRPFEGSDLEWVSLQVFENEEGFYNKSYSGNLNKFSDEKNFNDSALKINLPTTINYKYCGVFDKKYDSCFVNELVSIQEHLEGISDPYSKDSLASNYFNKSSFINAEDGQIQVRFSDDERMTNLLSAELFPSGWQSYADITSWLDRCPNDSICLLEEPELHLHPNLQRLLVNRIIELSNKKNLQLVISTHSNVFLNSEWGEKSTLIRVKNGEFESLDDFSDTIVSLGYKPSDILQSNSIIWVEGPSDRIYLKHWIKQKAPELIEGLHYSIMFFGGRLHAHLSASEDYSEDNINRDFINLSKINRNMVIVLDSDKDSGESKLTSNKKRLIDDTTKNGGFLWVTEGREIENYLNYDYLKKSILSIHPAAVVFEKDGKWKNLLKIKSSNNKKLSVDKVAVARDYVKRNINDFGKYDLENKINELVSSIRGASLI